MGKKTRRGGKVLVSDITPLLTADKLAKKSMVNQIDPAVAKVFSVFDELPLVEVLILEITMRLLVRLNEKPKEELDKIITEVYANTDETTITKNLAILGDAGIIPNVEEFMKGGGPEDENTPKRQRPAPGTPEPRRSERAPRPSPIMRQIESEAAAEAARRSAEAALIEAERVAKEAREEQYRIFQRGLNGKIAQIAGTYPELSPILQDLVQIITEPGSLSRSVDILFPKRAVEKWKSIKDNTARRIYEHHGIDTQCNNTIGSPYYNKYPPYSANGI